MTWGEQFKHDATNTEKLKVLTTLVLSIHWWTVWQRNNPDVLTFY